ncbi:(2Fe-2S)-binding protein [Nibricoccus sp. IMCC34717]|uniref:(2Fe-2S)-binding protein n=1 Tax=Nibricoccus sp. IMCC34717 TaxID=3034021 RepID=UPI00384B28D4
MLTLNVNAREYTIDVPLDTPLLWVLRDTLGLVGTKFGCGVGQCGACTIHLNGFPMRSCQLPVAAAMGAKVVTIEGLAEGDSLHPVQQAWCDEDVSQCGYCQAGQIMSAAALLKSNPHPTDADVDAAMAGNLCRCGTYQRIRSGIQRAASLAASGKGATS